MLFKCSGKYIEIYFILKITFHLSFAVLGHLCQGLNPVSKFIIQFMWRKVFRTKSGILMGFE